LRRGIVFGDAAAIADALSEPRKFVGIWPFCVLQQVG